MHVQPHCLKVVQSARNHPQREPTRRKNGHVGYRVPVCRDDPVHRCVQEQWLLSERQNSLSWIVVFPLVAMQGNEEAQGPIRQHCQQ